jgi:hypothetical protein
MSDDLSYHRRKTKIIVTLGETSSNKDTLCSLLLSGMDAVRISLRFLTIDKQKVFENLSAAMQETGIHIPIILGLRESDIRIGTFSKSPLHLKKNDYVRISPNPEKSTSRCALWCNNNEFTSLVKPGDKLLVDFGKIILTVISNEFNENESHSSNLSQTDLSSPTFVDEEDTSKAGNIMYMLNKSSGIVNEAETAMRKPKTSSFSGENYERIKRKPRQQKGSKVVICRVENDHV